MAATPSTAISGPNPAMPPAPPGEMPSKSVQKTRALAEPLVPLGGQADPQRVAAAVKAQTGMEIDPGEVAAIRTKLLERAATPPSPDQPPPENSRRKPGRPEDAPPG